MYIVSRLRSEASAQDIFLHRHDQPVIFRYSLDHIQIDRLGKSHIDECASVPVRLQAIPNRLCLRHHAAQCQQRDLRLLVYHLRLAVLDRSIVLRQSAICLPSGIPYRYRMGEAHSPLQIRLQLGGIFRCKYRHAGDQPQIADIKDALMRLSVRSDQPRAIHRQYHVQPLQAHIVQYLVKAPLQK